MEEGTTPAEGGNVELNAQVDATPTEATASAVADTASVVAEPSQTAPAKPDLNTLLSDPELRKQLLAHPELAAERKHWLDSERGRIRAEAQAEYQQRQASEQARLERERLKNMDELELGEEYKRRLVQEEENERIQAQLQPLVQQRYAEVLREEGQKLFTKAAEMAKEAGATDAEMESLAPQNYPSMDAFFAGLADFISERKAKKLAKEWAKAEAQAIVESRTAEQREKSPAPTALPPAEPGLGDREFLSSYANSRNPSPSDTVRAKKLMEGLGLRY